MEKEMTYEKAVKQLEQIVAKIENGEMDIDSLAKNLKTAKSLVEYCKNKLTETEEEVKKCLDM
ncbi:MAG: exodeoxyribonuclease VII small subunit [Prevotellaceae bacterium]|nr:exodeoxyribonuclease VII small subunit [Prevotellaceae bacterium]